MRPAIWTFKDNLELSLMVTCWLEPSRTPLQGRMHPQASSVPLCPGPHGLYCWGSCREEGRPRGTATQAHGLKGSQPGQVQSSHLQGPGRQWESQICPHHLRNAVCPRKICSPLWAEGWFLSTPELAQTRG